MEKRSCPKCSSSNEIERSYCWSCFNQFEQKGNEGLSVAGPTPSIGPKGSSPKPGLNKDLVFGLSLGGVVWSLGCMGLLHAMDGSMGIGGAMFLFLSMATVPAAVALLVIASILTFQLKEQEGASMSSQTLASMICAGINFMIVIFSGILKFFFQLFGIGT